MSRHARLHRLSAPTTVTVRGESTENPMFWCISVRMKSNSQQLLCVGTRKSEHRRPLYCVGSRSQLIWPSFTWENSLGSTGSFCLTSVCVASAGVLHELTVWTVDCGQLGSLNLWCESARPVHSHVRLVASLQFEPVKMNAAQQRVHEDVFSAAHWWWGRKEWRPTCSRFMLFGLLACRRWGN